jgi:hypothetical protein
VFGLMGLFGDPMLLFFAMSLRIGASQEDGATQMKAAMAGTPIRAAMLTTSAIWTVTMLADAVQLIL